jgi:hypothetical protein
MLPTRFVIEPKVFWQRAHIDPRIMISIGVMVEVKLPIVLLLMYV